MDRSRGRVITVAVALVIVALITAALFYFFKESASLSGNPQTTGAPAGDYNAQVWDVYVLIFILAGIVFFGIMALTLIFSLLYRERPGQVARQFHGNPRLEVVWTLIPVLIVVVMAVPTFSTINATTSDPPADAMKVTVIGHQWWFEVHYPELGVTTANELHLPVDRPVSLSLQSIDVIHSFWVPQIAGKVDMVPGHDNPLWFTPTEVRAEAFLGQCAEFCGASHANMRFRVFVDSQGDFDTWVKSTSADRPAPSDEVMRAGEQQFLVSGCITCHTVSGNPVARGTIGPNLTHIGSRSTIAAGIMDNNEQNMRKWISDPQAVKPGALMTTCAQPKPGCQFPVSQEALDRLIPYLQGLK